MSHFAWTYAQNVDIFVDYFFLNPNFPFIFPGCGNVEKFINRVCVFLQRQIIGEFTD